MLADIADFARAENFDRLFLRGKNADFKHFKIFPVAIILIMGLFGDLSADDADIDHHAAISVVMGIKDKRANSIVVRLFGRGNMSRICSRISLMPMPVLAEQRIALEVSRPITSSICFLTPSTSAEGRSILLMTGRISRFRSMARWTLARLCAWTPWTASTTRRAPSQAERERETS